MVRFALDPRLVLLAATLAASVASVLLWHALGRSWKAVMKATALLLAWAVSFAAMIQSGSGTSDLWTIDPTSKAGRVTLYQNDGSSLTPAPLATGTVNLLLRQTTAAGAGVIVWGIRNGSATRTVVVTRLRITPSFDGTGAATLMRYELLKGTGCTAWANGSGITASIFKTSLGQATGVDARILDTGLTCTSLVAQGGPIFTFTWGRITPSATAMAASIQSPPIAMDGLQTQEIELTQNEVLYLRNGPTNASVIGDTLFGAAWFYEK